jgi:hypothetical protein
MPRLRGVGVLCGDYLSASGRGVREFCCAGYCSICSGVMLMLAERAHHSFDDNEQEQHP